MAQPWRLPEVNGDDGAWGDILNQFLNKEHYNNDNSGAGDTASGGHMNITLRAGTTAAGTAPLKFSSGSLLTASEAGAIEFLTDKLYFTQTAGTTRKTVAVYDDSAGATGDMYYRDGSGYFTKLPIGTSTGQVLSVNGSNLPAWSTIFSGTTRITVSTSQPSSPSVGDLWVDTN